MVLSKEDIISKLIIGTAQFGLDYGISNKQGQLQSPQVKAIFTQALAAGINTLDTAAAYGESESTIQSALQGTPLSFRIISKYPPNQPEKSIRQALAESLERLGVTKLYGYLLHSYSTYEQNPGVLAELQELKAAGLVEKIGVSLYHPWEAEELLAQQASIDIVQFPYSIFDRRFEAVLPRFQQQCIQTHVRSVFLQGLYFLSQESLPPFFAPIAGKIAGLHQLAHQCGVPLGAMLLGFVLGNPHITHVVMGVESLETLQQNIRYSTIQLNDALLPQLNSFKEENEAILLPYNWPKT
ncbi:aldo/keto reductase [Pontibacter liquoris]|uniref:aldo/keto reductase n=1 Tax=Pontibacter liquoris TaxID=2905677 RepID=UPI001FA7BAA3|nr:aldo/keto reductase [Pontibacter liquoris]